jgi:ABC-2 type transport system permease protein
MIGLVRAELLRLRKRRAVWFLAILMVALVVVVLFSYWFDTRPPTEAQKAEVRAYYEQGLKDWEQHGDEELADCKQQEAEDRKTDPNIDYGCDTMGPPKFEDYDYTSGTSYGQMPLLLLGFGAAAAGFLVLISATYVGADHAAGTISTQLLFAPTRWKVWVAKATAIASAAVAAAVVAVGLGGLGAWAVMKAHPKVPGDADGPVPQLIGVGLWALLAVVVVSLVAFSISWWFGYTVATVGLLAAAVIGESILAGVRPSLTPWLPGRNIGAIVTGRWSYYVQTCQSSHEGVDCTEIDLFVTRGHGLVLWGLVLLVVTVSSVVWFSRRDVN